MSNPTLSAVVIDDDTELLRLIAMLLRRVGADAHTFFHGRPALEYLTHATPNIVILDVMLPEPNGIEILRQIRANTHLDSVPVLILSAKGDPATITAGLELGADEYMVKPYVATSLLARIRHLLEHGRAAPSGPTQRLSQSHS